MKNCQRLKVERRLEPAGIPPNRPANMRSQWQSSGWARAGGAKPILHSRPGQFDGGRRHALKPSLQERDHLCRVLQMSQPSQDSDCCKHHTTRSQILPPMGPGDHVFKMCSARPKPRKSTPKRFLLLLHSEAWQRQAGPTVRCIGMPDHRKCCEMVL